MSNQEDRKAADNVKDSGKGKVQKLSRSSKCAGSSSNKNDDNDREHSTTAWCCEDNSCHSLSAGSIHIEDDSSHGCKGDSQREDNRAIPILGQDETRRLFWIRLVVVVVLVLSMVGVALLVYLYTSSVEKKDFKKAFEYNASKLLDDFGSGLMLTLGAVDSFVISLLSFAKASNSDWPFVTNPDYAVQAAKLRSQAKAFLVTLYPLVSTEQREAWEEYSATKSGWVGQSLAVQAEDEHYHGTLMDIWSESPFIFDFDMSPVQREQGPYLPSWQSSPTVSMYSGYPYNYDILTNQNLRPSLIEVIETKSVVFTETAHLENAEIHEPYSYAWVQGYIGKEEVASEPIVSFFYPIIEGSSAAVKLGENRSGEDYPVVGVVAFYLFWRSLLRDILPPGSDGNVIVIENTCNQTFTYQVSGPETLYLGNGDLHDAKFDSMVKQIDWTSIGDLFAKSKTYSGPPLNQESCSYSIRIYPSQIMEGDFTTSEPIIFMVVAILIFCFTSIIFVIYDRQVESRQRKVLLSATQTSRIVSSLFPSVVRDRLFPTEDNYEESSRNAEQTSGRLRRYLLSRDKLRNDRNRSPRDQENDQPIADLFPETTVVFADIKGFTAWSSIRSPEQVFLLLEGIYRAIDEAARNRRVFKVETIGDSYVAVCGLPNPRKDHAVVTARFASDCRRIMKSVCRKLEASLGPETGDLSLRIGLNSGPVTGGVLRGEKSRFQLFGDTVNTASRMESTGVSDKIQATEATAVLLRSAGKDSWIERREERVEAKGKGSMQTYWIEPSPRSLTSAHTSPAQHIGIPAAGESSLDLDGRSFDFSDNTARLVKWNAEVLGRLLERVVWQREENTRQESSCGIASIKSVLSSSSSSSSSAATMTETHKTSLQQLTYNKQVVEEVAETIAFPSYSETTNILTNNNNSNKTTENAGWKLGTVVQSQLESYVFSIATKYSTKNHFHTFQHASHVTMSVAKLMSRIVSPERNNGITSGTERCFTADPLVQFACLFSALIHDVDHPGVSNQQLVQEQSPLAIEYKNRSVAEQNSLNLAWELLAEKRFDALRHAICGKQHEQLQYFRQLVVNCVMATDVMDKDMKSSAEIVVGSAPLGVVVGVVVVVVVVVILMLPQRLVPLVVVLLQLHTTCLAVFPLLPIPALLHQPVLV